jgi:hypothetical protein
MDRTIKGTIAVGIIAVIVATAILGSYLPMRKSQIFIATLQGFQAQPPSSLEDLESRLAVPLDQFSPIGQEELVRNTANSVLELVQRGIGASSTMEVIGFLDGYFDPIVARAKGMSFGQDIYLAGAAHEIAFAKTGNQEYLDAAKKHYLLAELLGPNRPQALYGLFDVYRASGDVENTKRIASKILTNWPTDQSIPGALAQFLIGAETSTKAKAK